MGWSNKCQFWPDLAIQPIKKTIGVSHLSARHHWKPFNLIWAQSEWTDLEILEISDFLDFQVPRYLKSGLGRAGLGPWVGPLGHGHGPTQARFEISGNLEIQKFGIPWNPCDQNFRLLDLLEPLRQRFQNFGPTGFLKESLRSP